MLGPPRPHGRGEILAWVVATWMDRRVGEGQFKCISRHFCVYNYCKGSHSPFDFLTFIFKSSVSSLCLQTFKGLMLQKAKIYFWIMTALENGTLLTLSWIAEKMWPLKNPIFCQNCRNTRPEPWSCVTCHEKAKQCKPLVFVLQYFTALWRESAPQAWSHIHSWVWVCSAFPCVTVAWLSWRVRPCNGAGWSLPGHGLWLCQCPQHLCTLRAHADAFLSALVCMRAGVWMHVLLTHASHTHANTHPRVHTAIPFLSYTFVHIHRPFWKLLFSERFYL